MDSADNLALVSVLEQVQHHHFTRALNGLLPPTVNAHKLKQVLDLNCHVGSWAFDLALAYPTVVVTGVDSDPKAIELARNNTIAGKINRVRFFEADLHAPLMFNDASFDFVHFFLSQPIFRPGEWPAFLAECMRVLKPGGTINLVNVTLGPGSSASYQRFALLIDQLLRALGYGFSDQPGTAAPGVYFVRLLQQAGFSAVGYLARAVNLGGWNNSGGRACCQLFLRDLLKTKDSLVSQHLLSDEEFDALIAQKEKDIVEEDFCATAALLSAFAIKK